MAYISEYENLDEEVKELLQNYKFKKATVYEPCTRRNYKDCLIGLMEELGFLNINYIFNPHMDLENNVLTLDATIKLINAVWTLLHHHKNTLQKSETLEEQNHILDHNNKQLQGMVSKLKVKVDVEKNESRACIASAQRVSDQSNEIFHKLSETRAKLIHVTKQKETIEKSLQNKISKMKLENDKLLDRLRNKSDSHVSCTDVCSTSLLRLKEKENKQRAVIAQLQTNNAELLRELVAMKEELILSGIQGIKLNKQK